MFSFLSTSRALLRCSLFRYDLLRRIRRHIRMACFLERRIANSSCKSSTNARRVPSVGERLNSSSSVDWSSALMFVRLVTIRWRRRNSRSACSRCRKERQLLRVKHFRSWRQHHSCLAPTEGSFSFFFSEKPKADLRY